MQDASTENRRAAEVLKSDTRWARFRLLFVIALALIPAAVVLIAGPDGEGGAASMDLRVLSIKEYYPQALAVAREWRGDAILNGARLPFRPTEDPGDLGLSYYFHSPGPPAKWLTVRIKDQEPGLVVETEDGAMFPGQPLGDPVDPLQLPLDSPEALSIILQNGGAEFLARHNNPVSPIGLHLEYRKTWYSEGPLVWAVSFVDRVSHESETIRIDAHTGELVE
jgi:hypothetical protein